MANETPLLLTYQPRGLTRWPIRLSPGRHVVLIFPNDITAAEWQMVNTMLCAYIARLDALRGCVAAEEVSRGG